MESDMSLDLVNQAIEAIRAGAYDDAAELLENAIDVNPNAIDAHKWLGMVHSLVGDTDDAIVCFSRAISQAAAIPGEAKLKSELLGLRAESYSRSGRFDLARVDLDEAIELDPTRSNRYGQRGLLRFNRQDFDGAREDFNCAIELDPRNGPAYCNRGMVHTRQGDTDRAFHDFEEALKCEPRDSTALLNRGLLLLTRGDRESALSDFHRAREINPGLQPNIERIYSDFGLNELRRSDVLYTRFFLGNGTSRYRNEVERRGLKTEDLHSIAGILIGLRGGAAQVMRAVMQTGEILQIQFGLPDKLFDEPIPVLEVFQARFPEYYFSVLSADGKPLCLNLIVPETGDVDDFASMVRLMMALSGEPAPSEGTAIDLMRRISHDVCASRPAVATVMLNQLGSDAAMADLVGFTEQFAAALLLGESGISQQETLEHAGWTAIPLAEITLETLAELNRRSCLILTGRANGSRSQAQAFDDWLESYRDPGDDVMEAILQPGRKVESDLDIMGKAIWTEMPDGPHRPHRFASAYNGTSSYFIPRNADPVPNISDFAPPT